MNNFYISLPAVDKRVTIGAYVRGVKLAKANPDARFDHGLTTWWSTEGRDIVRQFRRGMHERINIRAGESWRNQ